MDIKQARELLVPDRLEALDCNPYNQIILSLSTLARPMFLATMNQLARYMASDEIYAEVGSYQGGSLIGTLLRNNAKAICVENFCEFNHGGFSNSLGLLRNHLEMFGVMDRVSIFPMDFHQYFRDNIPPKIALYYYDGAHDEQNTYDGLQLAYPYLADEAIIVLDDSNQLSVTYGVNGFISAHPREFKIIFTTNPPRPDHYKWWNGSVFIAKIKENNGNWY